MQGFHVMSCDNDVTENTKKVTLVGGLANSTLYSRSWVTQKKLGTHSRDIFLNDYYII